MASTPRQDFEARQERKRTARPRDLEGAARARDERKRARAARGEAPRIEEAGSIPEALEAEREAGRREGAASRPATRTPRAINVSQFAASGPVPGVTAPMILDIGIITADELVNEHRLPVPSRLLVAFVVFGALGLAKNTTAGRAAAAFGWGIVVATFYSAANGNQPAGIKALQSLGDFLSGKNAKPTPKATTSAATTAPAIVA